MLVLSMNKFLKSRSKKFFGAGNTGLEDYTGFGFFSTEDSWACKGFYLLRSRDLLSFLWERGGYATCFSGYWII